MDQTPLEILGIDTNHIGQPRNDGTPGSSMYLVAIKLNRAPTPREAQLLVHHWDNPRQFSTMHRPGTAQVTGDMFILTSTTIEEVGQYHASTVRQAVDATNSDMSRLDAEDHAKRQAESRAREAHELHVREQAKDINF